MNTSRTSCKYWDCHLEKLEIEINSLDNLWIKLERNRNIPEDYEDLYRVYPLLDTTAALVRKMLIGHWSKNKKYTVKTIKPSNLHVVDTLQYLYSDNKKFFNGRKETYLLANIVSAILHTASYEYMDNRKKIEDTIFSIYLYLQTDEICDSCAKINLDNPKIPWKNFRKSVWFMRSEDCTCGRYLEIRSYIDSVLKLIKHRIDKFNIKY